MSTTSGDQSVQELLTDRADHSKLLKTHLAAAKNRMKMYADKHHSDRSFRVGDLVLLKLQPYAQATVVSRPCPKLAFKFLGPYKILEKIGAVAYKLDLPVHAQVHPVFHVSQLNPFTPNFTPVFSERPMVTDLDQERFVA